MWKDLKFPHLIYMTTHNPRKKPFIFLSAMEFVEFDGIKGVFKSPFCRKTSLKSKLLLIQLKKVWLMHKDEGNKDFQHSLLRRHSRNDAFQMFTLFPCELRKWFGVDRRK